MDMWKAFISVAQEKLPEAEIVHEELKNSRYVMLKNEKNLTDQQRIKFEEIRDGNYYEVSEA